MRSFAAARHRLPLWPGFVNDVERSFRCAAEALESSSFDNVADAGLAGLCAEAERHLLRTRTRSAQQRREGVHHPSHRVQIVFQLVVSKRFHDHPGSIARERLAYMSGRPNRISHIM